MITRRKFLKDFAVLAGVVALAPDTLLPKSDPSVELGGIVKEFDLSHAVASVEPSPLDRVNIKRLLIQLERDIATVMNQYRFEFNDDITRNKISAQANEYLNLIKSRKVMHDFKFVCDRSNNTPQVIDKHGLLVDLFVQPIPSVHPIQLEMSIS